MRFRSVLTLLCSAGLAAFAVGCADGGSSVAQPAGAVASSAQQGSVAQVQGASSPVHSGARRTLSVQTCSGVGLNAFIGGIGLGNAAAGKYAFVGAGTGNQACDDWSAIAGGIGNAISGAPMSEHGFIGGGEYNVVTSLDSDSAVVAGAGNTVSDYASAIVGGENNSVVAPLAVVGGGEYNTLSADGTDGFIGAGTHNTVSGKGGYIAAGGYNTVTGEGAVIDGGFESTAAGAFATIPGGYVNSAAGTYSFAAGARASAAQNGTFVWSDGSDGDTILTSSRAYQFLARASGGVTFWTNAASTVGATLAPGSGTWASASDRNLKTDLARIDDAAVLDKVASLPIERWSYKSERGVRHVGPMAQDFYAAFGVGEDDKHITSIDEDGVALAAIKALHAENARLRARLASTNARLASNDARLASTDARLARLTAAVAALRAR